MKDARWLISRLKSMNVPEVMWRVQQELLQKKEYKKFFAAHKPVTEITIPNDLRALKADGNRLGINWNNQEWSLFESLDLFDTFDYQGYKKKWNAGFQTENVWSMSEFSYKIPISQREDIGDIRTNWELNRHFQFEGLAKNYYVTGNKQYLDELIELFNDWNQSSLFLHGVQWTSAMEVAIRIVSWSYMYAFVEKAGGSQEFLDKIANGIKIMAEYVLAHRARYSSANNHLIVEMLGLGVAGILFAYDKWIDYSVKILIEELPRQNYSDGVNKEMSLHYQTFVMEAYGIMSILLRRNGILLPKIWLDYLENMSKFVADCCGDYGETVVFGDDDDGKILDFSGKMENYYRYVLQLMGIVLLKKYTDGKLGENIKWIATSDELDKYRGLESYKPGLVSHYKQGGYTILRSKDRKVLVGFDHAELGFDSIAAHGHCDALSIQLFREGKPILVDSGTYNYHVPKSIRNEMRSTKAHNTVYIEGKEQAEIKGPFLWGKRYRIIDDNIEFDKNKVIVNASIFYEGINHKRTIIFDFARTLKIYDVTNQQIKSSQIWISTKLPKDINGTSVDVFSDYKMETTGMIEKDESVYSDEYNHLNKCRKMVIRSVDGKFDTKILLEE